MELELWQTEKCAVCGKGFTAKSWENRHDDMDGLGEVHAGCCQTCRNERLEARPATAQLSTWQHCECPNPNCQPPFNNCARYAIKAGSAVVLDGDLLAVTQGTALQFTLICTGCGYERPARLWLRASPRGKRARPARNVADLLGKE